MLKKEWIVSCLNETIIVCILLWQFFTSFTFFLSSLHVNSRSYWLRETKAGSDKNGSNYLRFFCYKYLDVIYNGEAIITGLFIPNIFWISLQIIRNKLYFFKHASTLIPILGVITHELACFNFLNSKAENLCFHCFEPSLDKN